LASPICNFSFYQMISSKLIFQIIPLIFK